MIRRTYTNPYVALAAEDMAWWVSLDLGLRDPGEPIWITIDFVETLEARTYGYYWPRTIHVELRREMDEYEAAATAAHELRHCWQYRHWSEEELASHERKEADCREYEEEAMRRFWSPYRHNGSDLLGAVGRRKREATSTTTGAGSKSYAVEPNDRRGSRNFNCGTEN
ncbi:MAG: DUF6782 family putative metallopeptidase [Rhodothermales bacterium]